MDTHSFSSCNGHSCCSLHPTISPYMSELFIAIYCHFLFPLLSLPFFCMSSSSLFFYTSLTRSFFLSPVEPLPLCDRYPKQRCGEDPWCQRGWCMEGLLWGDSPGDRWWVRHALWSGVHLPGHDVCYCLKARRQNVIILGNKKALSFYTPVSLLQSLCLPVI